MNNRDIRDDPARTESPSRAGDAEGARVEWQAPERVENESHVHYERKPVDKAHVQRETTVRQANQHQYADRGTSWTSVILGWLTALGAGLILAGIVSGIMGAMLGAGQTARGAATESGTAGLIGLLITLCLAFLIGGYCAGRMASRAGAKHGLLVAALALLATLVLAGVGALLGTSLIDNLSGVTLPKLPADVPRQTLGTIMTVAGILALLFPFIGGALGGWWGAKTGRQRAQQVEVDSRVKYREHIAGEHE
ncbi:MAG TPA: hypothetical protein VKB53_10975 [Gammaproteobacteria bacterium]|nr:hypothetical protein [Gammaproteobacteria bacterium]